MAKRPDGALERDVLGILWSSERALTPQEIRERLTAELAYTSVATVLTRLCAKGLVFRRRNGRSFVYEPAVDEADHAARRMGDVLAAASDRSRVLAGFVGQLSRRDLAALRRMLAAEEPT